MAMNFRIVARVISQLGAELISSDEIALYELVKNGFDAKSPTVEINIHYRVCNSVIRSLQEPAIEMGKSRGFDNGCTPGIKDLIKKRLKEFATSTPPGEFCVLTKDHLGSIVSSLDKSNTTKEVLRVLGRINSIDIIDHGHGMTPEEVEDYYLTIGTTHRLREVEQISKSNTLQWIPTGEKGIGRLSAMRLGDMLELFTVPENDNRATVVSIPWNEFVLRRDEDVGKIEIGFEVRSKDASQSGTYLSISDLKSDWPRDKAETLGSHHLAKFIDPFPPFDNAPKTVEGDRGIVLRWNEEPIDTRQLIKVYCENSHNSLRFRLVFDDNGNAKIDSHFHFAEVRSRPEKTFSRTYTVADFSGFTDEQLKEVGPFEVLLFHFQRNRLKAIPQFAPRTEFKRWVDRWSGGLMIFRDGVRVLPYAAEGDDWLNLDSRALRGRGFRVNRIQVVGCVRISRLRNPQLIDQTNREGLCDNEVFRSFRSLVSRQIQENFVSELDRHLSAERPDLDHLSKQVSEEFDLLSTCAEKFGDATRNKDWNLAKEASTQLERVLNELRELNDSVENALQEKEVNRVQVLELAATGMAAESMAHDLEGLIETAITSLSEATLAGTDKRVSEAVRHIRSVHKSMLTQLKQISPGPARSRRRASHFNFVKVVHDAASFYDQKLKRHKITLSLPSDLETFDIYAVNGHIRQILDNLFRNSIYWLEDTRRKFRDMGPAIIQIQVDIRGRVLQFSDSGIGIAKEDSEWVFQPFNSRKEDGRGLGLFICRELCEFNKIKISLDPNDLNRWGRLRTFRLEFLD
jgi:signal transduction histidine kinase